MLDESSRPFTPVPLEFAQHGRIDVFAAKNNKTVTETLAEARYAPLAARIRAAFPAGLDLPQGIFLARLKADGDERCRLFLNSYGDFRYTRSSSKQFTRPSGSRAYPASRWATQTATSGGR